MKKAAAAVVIIASTFLAATLLSYVYVNEERVSAYLNEIAGKDYHVEVRSASFNLLSRSLHVEDVSVQKMNSENGQTAFTAGELSMHRIGLYSLFRGEVMMGTFDLKNGDLDVITADNDLGRVYGINLSGGPVDGHSSCDSCSPLSIIQNAEIQVDSIEYRFWEDRYKLKADSLFLNEHHSEFGAKTILVEPAINENDFFQSFDYRTELFRVSVSDLNFSDIDFSGIRNEGNFNIEKIFLGSTDLHITVDKSIEDQPDREESPLPLEVLNNMPFQVVVDSLLFQNADIRYSEYAEDGDKPGTIHFANTNAFFTDIHSGTSGPVMFEAISYLEGTGELYTQIQMSKDDTGHLVEVRGKLKEFDTIRLNNILMYLEGIRINSGYVYDLEFDFQMTESRSDGSIFIHYDELSINRVDKVNLNTGFGDRMSGFFYDQVVLRSASQNDEGDAREGKISREREPERSFFNNLWRSLRTGILDVIKRI